MIIPTTPSPLLPGGKYVETRLALFYLVYFSYMIAFSTYFPLWMAQRHYSPSEIAGVLVLPQLLRIFVSLVWARLAEWCGESLNILALSFTLAAVICVLIGLSSTLAEVFFLVGLLGIFTTGVLPLVDATAIAALVGRTERFGPVRLWGSIGTIVTLIGVGALLDFQPVTILIPVMVGMLALVVAASFVIPGRHLSSPNAVRKAWRHSFKQPGIIAFLASCFCMMAAHGALFSFFTLYLVTYGYSKSVVGLLWSLGFLAEIVGFASLPRLLQRYSCRTVILISFAAATVRFTAIGWGASSLTVLAMAQLLHAFTFATYHGASVALVQRLFPGDLGLRGQALYSGVTFGLGGVCGTLLAGWTWQIAGPQAAFTLSALFCGIGGAIVIMWLRESTLSAQAP